MLALPEKKQNAGTSLLLWLNAQKGAMFTIQRHVNRYSDGGGFEVDEFPILNRKRTVTEAITISDK